MSHKMPENNLNPVKIRSHINGVVTLIKKHKYFHNKSMRSLRDGNFLLARVKHGIMGHCTAVGNLYHILLYCKKFLMHFVHRASDDTTRLSILLYADVLNLCSRPISCSISFIQVRRQSFNSRTR